MLSKRTKKRRKKNIARYNERAWMSAVAKEDDYAETKLLYRSLLTTIRLCKRMQSENVIPASGISGIGIGMSIDGDQK